MGILNSSVTRVTPVFDQLMAQDPTGRLWLPGLLSLGTVPYPGTIGTLRPNHPHWWGKKERRLNPPVDLLKWLVQNLNPNLNPETLPNFEKGGVTSKKRQALAQKDPLVIQQALDAIDRSHAAVTRAKQRFYGRHWSLLEGASAPDACLETDHVLLVVEGKRTESSCTSTTTWMKQRSQLLRHMDAAREVRGGRQVLGMLIVEGEVGNQTPSPFWKAECRRQISPEMLEGSLPHRSAQERKDLANGFLGVTTWQQVCSEFRLPLPLDAWVPSLP